jgi:hypothetical protein
MQLYIKQTPTVERPLLAGDHTNWSRPDAVKLKERTYQHSGTSIAGNKPVTVGQGYSTIAWIPEPEGSWALPLRHERITSRVGIAHQNPDIVGNAHPTIDIVWLRHASYQK